MGHHRRQNTFSQGLPCLALAVLCAVNTLRAEDVHQGMRRDEILASWGTPSASLKQANREIISYGDGREVQLTDGVAMSVLNPNAVTATNDPQPAPALPLLVSRFKPALFEQFTAQIPAGCRPEISQAALQDILPAGLSGGWPLIAMNLFAVLVGLLQVVATWKLYIAAGEPGWAVLVPFYGMIVLLRIAGKPIWWILLLLFPVINILAMLSVSIGLARNFGRSGGFGLGLLLLPFVFYPILAFGRSEHSPV